MCPTSTRDGAKVLENPQCHSCADGLLSAGSPPHHSCSGDTGVPSGTPSRCELPQAVVLTGGGPCSHPHSPATLPSRSLPLRGPGRPRCPPGPSAQRPPPPGLLLSPHSCPQAPSSPPDSHRGGFTQEEEPGEKISSHHPLRPQHLLPSPSLRQAGSSLAPALQPPPGPPNSPSSSSSSSLWGDSRQPETRSAKPILISGLLVPGAEHHHRPCPEGKQKADSPLPQSLRGIKFGQVGHQGGEGNKAFRAACQTLQTDNQVIHP